MSEKKENLLCLLWLVAYSSTCHFDPIYIINYIGGMSLALLLERLLMEIRGAELDYNVKRMFIYERNRHTSDIHVL